MKEVQKCISTILFFIILVTLPIVTFMLPKQEKSDTENRMLEKFPKITVEKIKNKTFMDDFEKYIADHFVGRINWIETKVNTELIMGKSEINGIYIANDMLIEKLDEPVYEDVDKSISAINEFTDNVNIPVYILVSPTSAGIYADELSSDAPQVDQKKFLDYIYSGLSKDVTAIDVYNILESAKNEYIFYRNDHHWTSLGAYYAYNTAIQKLGFSPILYDKFDIEHASDDFKGTFYSRSLYNKVKADTIDIYRYELGSNVTNVIVNDGKEEKTYDSMYFRDYLETSDKYSTYLGENKPVVTIKTDVKNDKKLLVIKDSYANSFTPFLTQHYSEITLIDLRYISTSYKNVVNIDDYSQVLFLYNASTFATDENIKTLNYNW